MILKNVYSFNMLHSKTIIHLVQISASDFVNPVETGMYIIEYNNRIVTSMFAVFSYFLVTNLELSNLCFETTLRPNFKLH